VASDNGTRIVARSLPHNGSASTVACHATDAMQGPELGGRQPVNPHGAENSTEKKGVGRHPARQTPWTTA